MVGVLAAYNLESTEMDLELSEEHEFEIIAASVLHFRKLSHAPASRGMGPKRLNYLY